MKKILNTINSIRRAWHPPPWLYFVLLETNIRLTGSIHTNKRQSYYKQSVPNNRVLVRHLDTALYSQCGKIYDSENDIPRNLM